MSKNDLIKELQELALGTRLKRLSDSLMMDVGKIYKEQELDFEPRWFTMLYLLNIEKSLSIISIAEKLRLSHPAVVQFADQMELQKLVLAKKDKKDARKRIIELSSKGKLVYKKLQPILVHVEKSTHDLMKASGVDILLAIDKMEKQLLEKSMYERVKEGIEESYVKQIKIQPYHSTYKQAFIKLNNEAGKKSNAKEKKDRKALLHPEKFIKESRGTILFALNNKELLGSLSFNSQRHKPCELIQLAVKESKQRITIGSLLMQKAIEQLKNKNVNRITIETNRSHFTTIHLFEKLGFTSDSEESEKKINPSIVKMYLNLN
jgi:DNA-binding MarR family transcriptional regulator/N-acetylglutamate synthase-like GNAT family acetyltransferase